MPVYGARNVDNVRIGVIMVGLPARGKSLIAQKIVRYLSWLSVPTRCFNVGNYRRKETAHPTAEFFDNANAVGERLRRNAAEAALEDMIRWFEEDGGVVGVFDATNSTVERRKWIADTLLDAGVEPMFVESWCDDPSIVMHNIIDVKTTSPDYVGTDPEKAITDFQNRIKKYEAVYETLGENETDLTYVKLMNVGAQVVINRIQSYLESRVVYYIMNLHIKPRYIWLSRHGESEYNLGGQLGGDSNLSERGQMYAKKLPSLLQGALEQSVFPDGKVPELTVWTSTLKRTNQTARFLDYPKRSWKALDELDAGVCDGMTYEEIEQQYPEDFKARDDNKYEYRYRGGESYRDIVIRLEPIIMELERQENIMIVTHQAVLRCLYAYFMNVPQDQSPWMQVPLHSLIRLELRAFDTIETRISADIPAVSTHREKGSSAKHA
ncbi:6-phosphofructo-2-kinase-domain-containing protein [Yarrowia lipolytica]|jgi:6-phosphofructo-2-kinase/fructose-2,6-biphosphatase 2|uniref:fructose-2,6-bisphosphate 2-phosphatase n=2 Tax=Yarrowia lipolytica TaxID=4952 RepID=Q6C5J2_YARLI|nr:YALI0E17633p [Yarrowia lipolytica CLIB122]AOW05555.1 hypothetical protein YALI1_E20885g [Yarrowia lipolytica]KAB8282739.1 6-phosphofructo-2-kinase-domain-containing protein [Yarrowia lipolytica]KAE8173773.1 6-phosphofructo-2-kinase-domain-containing protein [Yarrowia lipolytica]KAJ8057045.1 6-phosphofructo-2-kinase-domain-containing protein [Yarrowia lipolytica]QNP99037.1 Fructose-2,6-bisphosphatase [Yarrowia lipolytica]|eukprot:XP_504070.1 YALI0E17633p [Yarrowia lipolytica CLIB122]